LGNDESKPPLVFTVDVEDWANSTLGPERPITARFLKGLYRILSLLEEADAKGTFFILGAAAAKFPEAARAVAAAGHDVAAHGYNHVPAYSLDRGSFREELRRVGDCLAGITGVKPRYYRAPDFSVDADSLWALEILAEEGYAVDSSIFPFRGRRYGIRWWPREPRSVLLRGGLSIVELPLPTIEVLGVRLPAAGGGYTRVMPYRALKAVLSAGVRGGWPLVHYCHPYELDEEEISAYRRTMPLKTRFSQGIGRKGMFSKINRMLTDFKVVSITEFLNIYKISIYELDKKTARGAR
jgi:polysaccharide deacetylase family protein (PEP-CTERM system associated)